MSFQQGDRPPTEEELRAAYEQQVKQLRVDDLLLETVVSLVNLGGRKAGLAPGTEDERDLDQVKLAIDAVSAVLPLVEDRLGPDAQRVRDVVSQLQMAWVQETGGAGAAPEGQGEPPAQGPAGPAPQQPPQRPPSSGRLWVPGQ
ncbi:hypothetical protein [Conexibacter sp. SYSU D00693]|uniref:hypothetical protein n=1 Tax=Conexibacter sp. SYSU D00693 TaxID=2812560 RepID=UPI00196BA4BD|nr:hypothetical protein [Conexibacter sp. SYSU D00693]